MLFNILYLSTFLGFSYFIYKYNVLKRIYLIYKISNDLGSISSNTETVVKINDLNTIITITYDRYGSKYSINLPYNRSLVSKMAGSKVYLEKGKEMVDITQQPGISYFVNASMLGSNTIYVHKGTEIHKFTGNEYPTFS